MRRSSDVVTKIYPRKTARGAWMAKSGYRTIINALKIFCWKTSLFWTGDLKKRAFKKKRFETTRKSKNRYRHPLYRAKHELIALVERELHDFIPWATIHYNTQLLATGRDEGDPSWANTLYNNKIDLAVNYVQRNRSRLLEWWCLRDGRTRWLNDNELIRIDLGISFDTILKEKLKREHGIEIKPDTNHYCGGVPVINKDGTLNIGFIAKMKMNWWMGRARFGERL